MQKRKIKNGENNISSFIFRKEKDFNIIYRFVH